MIKKNGEKIAAIAIAGALMMQSMSPIFALEGQVEDNLVSVEEVINMESSEEVAEEVAQEAPKKRGRKPKTEAAE